MFIFHEGMPGSGKSYEALVFVIIPALKLGRRVRARINGLNHVQIAALAEIPEDVCRDLLIEMTDDEVLRVHEVAQDKELIVVDEIHKYWRAAQRRMADDITDFISEHRHRGIDIIGMGQNLNDLHSIWRFRCNRKLTFMKLDAIGQENRYSWTSYNGSLISSGRRTQVEFTKVQSGIRSYETKYFGSYASTTADDNNMGTYSDDRANVLKGWKFRIGMPLAGVSLVASCIGMYFIMTGFSDPVVEKPETPKQEQVEPGTPPNGTPDGAAPKPKSRPKPQGDFFLDSVGENRIALTYLLTVDGNLVDFNVEVWDKSDNVLEVWRQVDLLDLGWTLTLKPSGVLAEKGDTKMLFRERNAKPRVSSPDRSEIPTEVAKASTDVF